MNFLNLFKFIFIFISCVNFINCEGEAKTCIMSGQCGMGLFGPIPCSKSTAPIKHIDEDAQNLLADVCPKYKDSQVCCDYDQLRDMKQNLQAMIDFKKCAPCFYNFVDLYCDLACNPRQSSFLNVTSTDIADDYSEENKDLKDSKEKKLKVTALSYSIKLKDANRLFSSCEKAYSRTLGLTFLSLFADAETPTELLYNIGQTTPFLIDFLFFDNNRTFHLIPNGETSKYEEENVKRTNNAIDLNFKNCNEISRNRTCKCSQCSSLECSIS